MKETYHLLYPLRTILITSEYNGKEAIMPADWCIPVSFDPQLFGVAVGKQRFTHSIISKSGVFAINLVTPGMKEKMLFCGTRSGRNMDKFRESGLTREIGECTILVKDSPASIECIVVDKVETGDHTFFIGRVVSTVIRVKGKVAGLYHIGGNKFTTF